MDLYWIYNVALQKFVLTAGNAVLKSTKSEGREIRKKTENTTVAQTTL